MRSDRQALLAKQPGSDVGGAWLLSAHGVAAALFAVTRLFLVSFPVLLPGVRLRTKMTIGRRRDEDRSRPFTLMCWPRKLSAHVLGRRRVDWRYCGSRRAVRHPTGSRCSPATPAHLLLNGFRCARQSRQNLWMTL